MYKYKYIIRGHNPVAFKGTTIFIAKGFERIVHGGRGAYVEFSNEQIIPNLRLEIPEKELWRAGSPDAYYVEYRDRLYPKAKIYFQMKEVDYADYKVGYWYISPIYLEGFVRDGKYSLQGVGASTLDCLSSGESSSLSGGAIKK